MKELLFLKPIFKEMIWGGDRLRSVFGYDIPSEKTGECWAISANPHGDCEILSGSFKGMTLSELWSCHRELFGDVTGSVFPLLVKIIDAKEDLSIQVHPDDKYASKYENGSLGKTECWYVLDCNENSSIIIGHNASSKKEMCEMIEKKEWSDLIREVPVRKGDFFQIEPGCIHAIKAGTMVLETQQNSDITYRVYDYDRLQNGVPRQLHIKKSIDVATVPFKQNDNDRIIEITNDMTRETLVSCKYYNVERIKISHAAKISHTYNFLNISVINGTGNINGTEIKKGTHFIAPFGYGDMNFEGSLEMIFSFVNN